MKLLTPLIALGISTAVAAPPIARAVPATQPPPEPEFVPECLHAGGKLRAAVLAPFVFAMAHAFAADVAIDAWQRCRTIDGFGTNVNTLSWSGDALARRARQ